MEPGRIMKAKSLLFPVAALAVAAASAAMPDKPYVVDYYAPPVDMVPARPIADYSLNTRVPDYHWLKYDGAYALALGIGPISREKIEKEIATDLINTNKNKSALSFSLEAEKNAQNRRVGIYGLNIDAAEFKAISFKSRSRVNNAGDSLKVIVSGSGIAATLDTEVAKTFDEVVAGAKNDGEIKARLAKSPLKEEAKDGFVSYSLQLTARPGAKITSIQFETPAASADDFSQYFEIIDLHLKRREPKARFEDLPPRTWVKKDGEAPVADLFEYVRSEGAADSLHALPDTYELRPQTEKESDGGFSVEYVTANVDGREFPAIRITLEKGPRCYLRFPVAFDGLEYNTMTFLGNVEVFDGAKPLLGDKKPMLWGTNAAELNRPFDTFQIAFFSSTDDFFDWGRLGIAQADYCQNKNLDCSVSTNAAGWRAFAYDIANSDPSNTKSSFYTKLTHWSFYYDNRKIPEGKKVVVTIADPRLTRGLMLTGGDREKYAEFLKSHDMKKIVDFDAMKHAFEPPKAGRLAKPVRFIENRIPIGRIYQLPAQFPREASAEEKTAYTKILTDAVNEFRDVLQRKYSLANDIKVLSSLPKGPVANSIIIGGNAFAKIDKATYDSDMKAMAKKPGCAIRSDGTNIYIYASADYNYAGNVRGLAFGLYELLENNTDLIYSHPVKGAGRAPATPSRIFSPDASGTMDFVWGDGFVHVPPVPESSMFGVCGPNRVAGFNWQGDWENGRHRTRSINHWWGYGTEPIGNEEKGKPNDTWGRRADGTQMVPGCYTGHPCLIRVLDRAKESYLSASAFKLLDRRFPFYETQAPGKAYAWKCYDVHGLWVEDSISMCQCSECLTPIRLADGSTVGPDSPYFRSTQFFSNGSAMINSVNVYAKRNARIESIGYLWMAPVPLITVSRNYDIRFCPYIRKNYFVPIFAPMNDMHWRAINAWAQQDVRLAIYEYFLFIRLRPWADVAVYDIRAELGTGKFYDWMAESEHTEFSRMEKWVMERILWGSMGDDVPALRAYYLKRTFREAAESVGRFYELIMACAKEKLSFASPMEFEDEYIIYRNAMRSKAPGSFKGSVAEEAAACLEKAKTEVKDPIAAAVLKELCDAWDKYRADAEKSEAAWAEERKADAAVKAVPIPGKAK